MAKRISNPKPATPDTPAPVFTPTPATNPAERLQSPRKIGPSSMADRPTTSQFVADMNHAFHPTYMRTPPITEDQIRRRAYEIYEARMRAGVSGDASSDWHEAERQLRELEPHA